MRDKPASRPDTSSVTSYPWHEFYGSRWNKWHENWLTEVVNTPKNMEARALLSNMTEIGCDAEIAVRLAFIVASHKPATQSELAKDPKRQQRIKRKLNQARKRLCDSARLLDEVMVDFETALMNADSIAYVREIAYMCDFELEAALDSRALEFPSGHELFTLIAYVKDCSGKPHYAMVTDLLDFAYRAAARRCPHQHTVEKQFERFAKMPNTLYPQTITKFVSERRESGKLKEHLLACFPGRVLP